MRRRYKKSAAFVEWLVLAIVVILVGVVALVFVQEGFEVVETQDVSEKAKEITETELVIPAFLQEHLLRDAYTEDRCGNNQGQTSPLAAGLADCAYVDDCCMPGIHIFDFDEIYRNAGVLITINTTIIDSRLPNLQYKVAYLRPGEECDLADWAACKNFITTNSRYLENERGELTSDALLNATNLFYVTDMFDRIYLELMPGNYAGWELNSAIAEITPYTNLCKISKNSLVYPGDALLVYVTESGGARWEY